MFFMSLEYRPYKAFDRDLDAASVPSYVAVVTKNMLVIKKNFIIYNRLRFCILFIPSS